MRAMNLSASRGLSLPIYSQISFKSSSAIRVILTRYRMGMFEFFQESPGGAYTMGGHILFGGNEFAGKIHGAQINLIGFRVHQDCVRLTVDSQNDRAAGFVDLIQ
jgi:hypothetical protein